MIELSIGILFLALGLAGFGLYFEQSMFTFVSGIIFLFLALETLTEEPFLGIALIGIGIWQIFSTFFVWRRG